MPEDCLVICNDNLFKYYGRALAKRAVLSAAYSINPNFSNADQLEKAIDGVGTTTAKEIVAKRPYENIDEFLTKFPKLKKRKAYLETNLDFFPFT